MDPMRTDGAARRMDAVIKRDGSSARTTGHLLAMLLLAPTLLMGLTLLLWLINPGTFVANVEALVISANLPFFVTAAVLAHRNHNHAAAWVIVFSTSVSVFVTQAAAWWGMNPLYQASDASALTYLALPVLLSGFVLSRRQTLALATVLVACMATVPLFEPAIKYSHLVPGPILLVALITILTVVFSAHTEHMERERTAALAAEVEMRRGAEAELERHRDELEQLVRDRTADLEDTMSQLREANSAKSRFLANMSHELRTPLNSIIGFTGMVHDGLAGEIPEEARRQLAMANNAGKHLLGIVNDLLNLSKIESGATSVDLRPVEVSALVSSVCEMVTPLASGKGLKITCVPGPPVEIRTDPGKLQQILLNLTSNAIKFTESGGVVVSHELMDGQVVVSVQDTGPGIPAEERDSVFSAFHQLPTLTTAKAPGAGLGLTISRELARLLGGDLVLSATDDTGARFILSLPTTSKEPT